MRITNVNDLSQLNKALSHIDSLRKQVSDLQEQLAVVHKKVTDIHAQHAPAVSHNLTFNWTGAGGQLDWAAGSLLDKQNTNVPVTGGLITGLAPNTYYWLAWNKEHKQMLAHVGTDNLLTNPNNTVICQVFTGSGIQTGVAGGGGSSSSGSDLSGSRYKLF
jgi:hypothetical protein